MSNEHKPNYSVIPPTGAIATNEKGSEWPSKFVLPQGPSGSFSMGGWTELNEGFVQQTFLGASIRNFNIAGGFGDTSSNLQVSLVEDEYNKSDSTFLGLGDDVYHSGNGDKFVPPPVGTPVFFKFGKNWATVEQAYRRTIEETYNITAEDGVVIDTEEWKFERDLKDDYTPHPESGYDIVESGMFSTFPYEASGDMPNERDKYYLRADGYVKNPLGSSDPEDPRDDRRYYVNKSFLYEHDNRDRGFQHFVFGGILQSVSENRSANGNPVQEVTVTDPREILGNCSVILNDYAGTTFNNKNLFNVYGFLEYDPSDELQKRLDNQAIYKWVLEKQVSQVGEVRYFGNDKEAGVVVESFLDTSVSPPETKEVQINPSPVNWDVYKFPQTLQESSAAGAGKMFKPEAIDPSFGVDSELYPKFFPITGEGFSRRSEQGIPWYRVSQGLAALFEQYGKLPKEYMEAGFGGTIDFRGFNYIVDFGGIPLEKIPKMYMLKYNQTDLLSLAQELCDVISHDLFVSLLPIIDPLTEPRDNLDEKAALMNAAFARNNYWSQKASEVKFQSDEYKEYTSKMIHGIIRVDAIDRSKQPAYGSIQSYINKLENQGIYVENRNIGSELANITTDKFVAGAQEVEMYYFSTYKDRDSLEARKNTAGVDNRLNLINEKQWSLEASLKQQVLPFYGFLGKDALSIPRGFGSYQQIMLDASTLDAFGVGNYYVATELELRHALVSYASWTKFLSSYNDAFIEELGDRKQFYKDLNRTTSKDIEGLGGDFSDPIGTCITPQPIVDLISDNPDIVETGVPQSECLGSDQTFIETQPAQLLNREFGVSVPRCVFNSDKNFMNDGVDIKFGEVNTPASPCSPPYGYPLYYKRAQNIGIPEAGVGRVSETLNKVRSQLEAIKDYASEDPENNIFTNSVEVLQEEAAMLNQLASYQGAEFEASIQDTLNCIYKQQRAIEGTENEFIKAKENIGRVDNILRSTNTLQAQLGDLARKSEKNAKKIYEFVRKIAQENLGKKFLVKIPRHCNVNYSEQIQLKKYFGFQGFAQDENGDPNPEQPIYGDVTTNIRDAYSGPFGFRPIPVNASGDVLQSQEFIFKMHKIKSDQLITKSWDYQRFLYKDNYLDSIDELTRDKTYDYGALKGNYNPISEKWAFNYKPEPQGGFLNFALYPRNLSLSQVESRSIPNSKLSPAARYNLIPKDISNFVGDNGRVECYVRFDNSQYLDFRGINADSMTQEVVEGNTTIPDIISELDNTNVEHKESINDYARRQSGPDKRPNSVAYVKCSVEPRLFMPPKSEVTPAMVFGRDVRYIPNFSPPEVIQETDELGCPTYICVRPYAEPIFEPSRRFKDTASSIGYERILSPKEFSFNNQTFQVETVFGNPNREIIGGGLDSTVVKHEEYVRRYDKSTDSFIIDTESENLDSDHVYALITLPGVISTNINQRYMDSNIFSKNAGVIKNIMTQDVVRGPLGFEKPAQVVNKKVTLNCSDFTFEDLEAAEHAQRESIRNAIAQSKEVLVQAAPSPVYPNIVALPLLSTERCYGPWRSAAQIDETRDRYSDIGGKVEFVKDEDLAPWNYAGYQLMNEAGLLQAEFSNSLLLFSERGGFVFPSTPSGLSLGKELQENGPLVTSLSVNVSEAGVKTTVKMDLYTSRFGKLQKQKEDAIAQIVRERQKIMDTNNEMVRKGLIRSATAGVSSSIQNTFNAGNNIINNFNELNASNEPSRRAVRVRPQRRNVQDDTGTQRSAESFLLSSKPESAEGFYSNDNDKRKADFATAEEEQPIPISEAEHPQMPSKVQVNMDEISNQISPLFRPKFD